MTERQEDRIQEIKEDTVEENKEKDKRPSSGSAFEGIYERLPDISIRSVDRFIILCVIVLIVVVLAGVLKANHIF